MSASIRLQRAEVRTTPKEKDMEKRFFKYNREVVLESGETLTEIATEKLLINERQNILNEYVI